MSHLVLIGLNHITAPIALRERVHHTEGALIDALHHLMQHPCIHEVAMLSTCNRVEVVLAVSDEETARATVLAYLADACGLSPWDIADHLYTHTGLEAVHHLMRVAAGLDSLVLGETQILGQLAGALRAAQAAKTVGATLNLLLTAALHAGKRARAETRIAHGARSVASAAAQTALHAVLSHNTPTILILGAGEMGQAAARALQGRAVRVVMLNRTDDRARHVAATLTIESQPWAELATALTDADAVITATGAQSVVLSAESLAEVMLARGGRPLTVVDLAVPRAVESNASALPNLALYDIDALRASLDHTHDARQVEAARAERLCIAAAHAAQRRLDERGAIPAIIALRQRAKTIAQANYAEALRHQPDLPPEAQAAMIRTINRTLNQALHPQTLMLKAHAVRLNADANIPVRLNPTKEMPDA